MKPKIRGWKGVKKHLIREANGSPCCGICGEGIAPKKAVCHHRRPKHLFGRNQTDPEVGELRHAECEAWAHKAEAWGNPTRQQIADYLETRSVTHRLRDPVRYGQPVHQATYQSA